MSNTTCHATRPLLGKESTQKLPPDSQLVCWCGGIWSSPQLSLILVLPTHLNAMSCPLMSVLWALRSGEPSLCGTWPAFYATAASYSVDAFVVVEGVFL
eukprot:3713078-Amphidinium_carterae.1